MNTPTVRRRYPIPTHLAVEPPLLRTELGPVPVDLTFRQAAILALAAGGAYWLWQGSGLPAGLAAVLTGLTGLLTLTAAFITVGGRSADLWLRDVLHYAGRPRRLVWQADAGVTRLSVPWEAPSGPPPVLGWAPPHVAPATSHAAPGAD